MLVDFDGVGGRDIVALEKQHHFLDRLLRGPGALNHADAPLPDAGHFDKAGARLLNTRAL
ncbi:MAG TPA: hypothetical protein VH164_11700 [Ktedonobacteraceae bacterium]|nr:hypothetical protein [Ktedonobacteraceae bacterium]